MQKPIQITWRDFPPSDALEARIREEAEKLDGLSDRISSCHVVIEQPHKHQRHGKHFRVRVELTIPGDVLVADRDPPEHSSHEDAFATVLEAFDAARRMLRSRTERRRDLRREAP